LHNETVIEEKGNVILSDKVTTSGDEQVKIKSTGDEAVNEQCNNGDGLTATIDTGKQHNCK